MPRSFFPVEWSISTIEKNTPRTTIFRLRECIDHDRQGMYPLAIDDGINRWMKKFVLLNSDG